MAGAWRASSLNGTGPRARERCRGTSERGAARCLLAFSSAGRAFSADAWIRTGSPGVASLVIDVDADEHAVVQEVLREAGYNVAVACLQAPGSESDEHPVLARKHLDALKHTAGALTLRAASILSDPLLSDDSREAAREILADSRELLRFTLNLLDITAASARPWIAIPAVVDLASLISDVLGTMEAQASIASVR